MYKRQLDSYLGAVGPGKYNEAEAGYRLAKYYIDAGYTDFAIFGGSIMFGAEQHAYRVGGMMAAMVEYETGIPNTDSVSYTHLIIMKDGHITKEFARSADLSDHEIIKYMI